MRHITAAMCNLLAVLLIGIWIEVMLRGGMDLYEEVTMGKAWVGLLGAFLLFILSSVASAGGSHQ